MKNKTRLRAELRTIIRRLRELERHGHTNFGEYMRKLKRKGEIEELLKEK